MRFWQPRFFSQIAAIAFAKETLVAKSAFDAYFTSCALRMSHKILSPEIGACSESKIFWDFFEAAPITILSGFKVSSIAVPSLKNSGQLQ